MRNNVLLNYLKLAYSPVSNYDFSTVKDDPIIANYMNSGKIYIIAQRPVITFEKFNILPKDDDKVDLTFEIRQSGVEETLSCKFEVFQSKLSNLDDRSIHIGVHYIYPYDKVPQVLPFNHLANFVLKRENDDTYWFSPEKLLYHYLRDAIDLKIDGDFAKFLKYKLHYIGKATEQDIVKRLNGHSSLQEILSKETPLEYQSLPRDEIVILFLDFEDNLEIRTVITDDDIETVSRILAGIDVRPQNRIYLDAEKALINALQPTYNKVRYNNYPISKDGLHQEKLDYYSYSFIDPITIVYGEGEIKGGAHFSGDIIFVENGKISIRHHDDI